jgi:hypothetical protein
MALVVHCTDTKLIAYTVDEVSDRLHIPMELLHINLSLLELPYVR